jgi:hypothetical protein
MNIRQTMVTGKTKWTPAFTLETLPESIVIHINISLLPSNDVNRVALGNKTGLWQTAINATWNDRFYAVVNDRKLPIIFDVQFTHRKPHHRVVVHPGRWNPDQHNWYVNSPPNIIAHEIGHMIGAYDEYRGGALSATDPKIDTASIMGSRAENGVALPRHLELVKQSLEQQFGNVQIITK